MSEEKEADLVMKALIWWIDERLKDLSEDETRLVDECN